MRRCAAASILLALAGCGYRLGEPTIEGAHSVALSIPENQTLRRGNEFGYGGHEIDLAQQVRDMVLARTEYDLLPEGDADLTARVEIVEYETPFLVADRSDRPLVSDVRVRVRLKIQRRDGTIVYEGDRREVGYLVPGRDEDEGTARAEAFEKIARWVVSRLEGGW
ncbi:MAG: hypothetical protein FD180_3465 [Planctomycetota bacterium]|nr:MAG: hypothetical protein FD180_3465 [Planctomycetota bacterium]